MNYRINNSHFSLIYFGFMSICMSCKNEYNDGHPLCGENNFAEMHIVEYGTQKPIEGAEVYLFITNGADNGTTTHDYVITDQTGTVTWPCNVPIDGISACEPDLYYGECGSGYAIQESWVADGVYELFPRSWLRVVAIDDIPYNANAVLKVGHPTNGGSTGISYLSNGEFVILEGYGNLEDDLPYVVWLPAEDSVVYFNTIPIFCTGFDTTNYAIHY